MPRLQALFIVALIVLTCYMWREGHLQAALNKARGAVGGAAGGAVDGTGAAADATVDVVQNVAGEVESFTHGDEYELLPDRLFDDTEGFLNSREPHNTWEPSTVDFARVGNDRVYKAYGEDLKANVDQGIINSHRDYVSDSNFLATTGASHASARDDFNPAVQFHGLPRKAHYAHLGAERSARTGQTETPEQVVDIAEHNSSGYIL